MRAPLRLAAFLLLLVLAPVQALALPPVWTVRMGSSTIVLFGSVHVLPPGLDWRPPALKAALAQADDVWFEAPMDAAGQSAATSAALAKAFLPKDQHLSQMLTRAGRDRLAKVAADLGVQPEQFDQLQPWYAELLIETALYQKVGAKGSQGVEEQLWSGLSPTARRHEFETPAEQVGFFADASQKDQLASLEETLRTAGDAEHEYDVLLKAWLAGDLRTLDKEVVRPLRKASPDEYETLVVKRNERWIRTLTAQTDASAHTVVIVGMGHLIGPDGLPARLRALGYDVEGPK